MKNKKLIATIASLCLVVVALVAAVVGILAAAQQNVKGTFSVTYTANDVSAIVTLSKKAQKDGSYGSLVSHEFLKRQDTSTQNLSIAHEDLNVQTSLSPNKFVVYKFEFKNTNTANSMTITTTYNKVNSGAHKDENVLVYFNWNSEPQINYANDSAVEIAVITNGTEVTNSSIVAHNVEKATRAGDTVTPTVQTLYIMVAIADINADAQYYLGGSGENSIAFALTRTGVTPDPVSV